MGKPDDFDDYKYKAYHGSIEFISYSMEREAYIAQRDAFEAKTLKEIREHLNVPDNEPSCPHIIENRY